MSLERQTKGNCPHCQTEQEVSYYSTVNVTIDDSLKEKVLRRKLNANECKNCEKEIDVYAGFLYHDMANRLMINLAIEEGGDSGIEGSEMMQDLKKKGYIFREVNTYPELLEKISIFDQGVNDKIIEAIGAEFKDMLKEASDGIDFHVFFKKVTKRLFKKELVFECFSDPSQAMELKYDFKKLSDERKKDFYNINVLRT